MTEDLERLCANLDELADLLDSNDDESNADVCRKAKDAIRILYAKADEFYEIANRNRPEYHFYGMRNRGYSPGAQPEGCVKSMVDQRGRYYNILVYPRMLTEDEQRDYELDFLS